MTIYSAVRTTGIYCRPGCGARPRAENVRTFALAAAAEAAGYRACLRCRPYRIARAVGDDAPELVCRAVRLIIDGVLDDATEEALGARLGVSARHLRRMFHDHLGMTPDQFARSRRAHFARRLLDDSDLSIGEVAFASGFGSLRQFNREMRTVFRAPPRELRERRRRGDRLTADGGLAMRMPFSAPYDWPGVLSFLAARAIPGVETVAAGVYRRTITLDGAAGLLEIGPGGEDHLLLRAHLPYWEGVIHVFERASRLVGVGTGPGSAAARIPGAWGPFEIAVHTVVAAELGHAAARESLGLLVRRHGTPVAGLEHGLTHAFPSPEALVALDAGEHGLSAPLAESVGALAWAVRSGAADLDGGAPAAELLASLTAVPGVDLAAARHIALRLGASGVLERGGGTDTTAPLAEVRR